jgi:hypothetical protein
LKIAVASEETMAIKDLLEKLSYSECNCPIDYEEELGLVRGICPAHKNSILMVNGIRMEVFQKLVERRKLDSERKQVV